MKINEFDEYLGDGNFKFKERDINVYNFGGVVFIRNKILVERPKGIGYDKVDVKFSMFCTVNSYFEYSKCENFKDRFDTTNYIHYKCTKKEYEDFDIYINKDLLLSIDYDGGSYIFNFKHDDIWGIECKEYELIEVKE